MKTVPASGVDRNDFVFYGLYLSLPVGAAFVDSERKVFATNGKMRAYFPILSGGQEGLPICETVCCPQFQNRPDPYGPRCKDCVPSRALIRILDEEKPMKEAKWQYVRRCVGRAAGSCDGLPSAACQFPFWASGTPRCFSARSRYRC